MERNARRIQALVTTGKAPKRDRELRLLPGTIMGWYRRLIAHKFDGSKLRRYPGRPRMDDEIEQWGDGSVGCKERLGGLLKYYHREAA